MRIEYTAQIWREGAQFVARAMPIDVISAGSTPDQARAALDEAVGLVLSTAQGMGTLREVLEECAYEWHEGSWDEIPVSVIKSNLKTADLSRDEYFRLLQSTYRPAAISTQRAVTSSRLRVSPSSARRLHRGPSCQSR